MIFEDTTFPSPEACSVLNVSDHGLQPFIAVLNAIHYHEFLFVNTKPSLHPRSVARALESIKLAEVWYEWEGNGASGSVLKWCEVEDQIVVEMSSGH